MKVSIIMLRRSGEDCEMFYIQNINQGWVYKDFDKAEGHCLVVKEIVIKHYLHLVQTIVQKLLPLSHKELCKVEKIIKRDMATASPILLKVFPNWI